MEGLGTRLNPNVIALERKSESKEPPLQKTRRQRREKTTGCERDDEAVLGKTTPCILALGDLADQMILELVKRARTLRHQHHASASSYTARYTWLQQKSTCISPDILLREAYSAHAYS